MIGCLTETTTCVVAKPLVSIKEGNWGRKQSSWSSVKLLLLFFFLQNDSTLTCSVSKQKVQ